MFFFVDPDQQPYGGYPNAMPYPPGQMPYPPPNQQPGYPPYPQQPPMMGGFPPYQQPNIGFVNPSNPAGYAQPEYPQQPGTNPPYMDPEDPGYAKGFGFDDKSIRQGFIRKVYSILSVSIFAFLIKILCVCNDAVFLVKTSSLPQN